MDNLSERERDIVEDALANAIPIVDKNKDDLTSYWRRIMRNNYFHFCDCVTQRATLRELEKRYPKIEFAE
jgi:hypothetical protein